VIVGISGASGVTYGVRVLDALRELGVESHLVVTRAALLTLSQETEISADDLMGRADVTHRLNDVGASIASGSFRTMGMIVAPCSVRTMSEIATGVTSTLLTRAADVVLKERRPLVLMVRETPLHLGHLRTMTALAEMGAVIEVCFLQFLAGPNAPLAFLTHWTQVNAKSVAAAIKEVGAKSLVISSDLGQSQNMTHPDGIEAAIAALRKENISDADIDLMMRKNPARLLGLAN